MTKTHYRNLIDTILDESIPAYSLRAELLELTESISRHLQFSEDITLGETKTSNGLAISPKQAVMCLEDANRTITFIRGLHQAIKHVFTTKDTAHVLYAGTGPLAPLALPLMERYSAKKLRFTLLDIHSNNLDSVKTILAQLGLTDRAPLIEQADASDYKIQPQFSPDIILSETMNGALRKEPQVAIARNLYLQAPDALLVPSDITVTATLINPAREFSVQTDLNADHNHTRDRIEIGDVFSLNMESILSWPQKEISKLPAATLILPKTLSSQYDLFHCTKITTFGDQTLQCYDSGLTTPLLAVPNGQLLGGSKLQYEYRLGDSPELVISGNLNS